MRRGLIYALAVCLLACLISFTAPEAQAAEHTHCVCGGHSNGVGDHVCSEPITWEPWDGTGALQDGHSYYLNDTDGDSVITLSSTITLEDKHINLCLNGVELTSTSRTFLLKGKKTAGLSICDCGADADWGCISSTSTGIAPVLHSYTNKNASEMTINLYSGHMVAKDNNGQEANSAGGVLRLGNNTAVTGSTENHKGTFNMYGGSISGGQAYQEGGNVYVSVDCYFNMYGGSVSGGQTASNGGNFFVSGHLNLQGGKISGGSASGLGGGIYLSGTASHGSTITVGGTIQVTDNTGSNVFLPEGKLINIGTLAKPARIGVLPIYHEFFAYTANESDARYFFGDIASNGVVFDDGTLKLTSHDHCFCGDSAVGVGDHSCVEVNWTALSFALTEADMTADTVDFGKLPAGKYFLDSDVTVTGSTNVTKNISLCLNGYSVSRETGKIFGYLKNGYTLNICDCSGSQAADGSWSWDGTVTGGTHTYGSVIYTHYGSTLNIYGGSFTGHGTISGGVFVAANDGAPDLNADGVKDGKDFNLATPSVMNLYNGSITGCDVTNMGGSVTSFHTAVVNLYGGTISGGSIKGVPEKAMIVKDQHVLAGSYTSLAAALKKVQDGQFIRLIGDFEEDTAVSGAVYLDMNGHDLSGITVDGTLYAFDTTTDSYEGSQAGILTYTLGTSGQVLTDCTTDVTGQIKRYMAIPDGDGYSFHRFYVGITAMTLRPGKTGMGYKATFAGDQAVKNYLSGTKAYGYELWIMEDVKHTRGYSASKFGGLQELTLGLNNVLSPDNEMYANYFNADTQVHAVAYLRLANGQVLRSAQWSRSLKEITQLADTYYSTYTSAQQESLQTMYSDYESLLLGWDLPNIHHAKGNGWTSVDAAGFAALLTNSGKTYTLGGKGVPYSVMAEGKYILTEDVTLKDMSIRIASGDRVSICLNGHTISSNTRVFKVRGTLDICDCGTTDGTITSSLSSTNTTYAPIAYIYNGTMNLYGGNMKATGQVTAAGVLATGKSGSATGTLNIYGGTVSGGNTSSNSGLIALWDASSVNMYSGKLYGGQTAGSGGGISIGSGSRANLYGGEIFENTANTGGGVYITSGETQVYMGSRLVIRNNTATTGGNVQHNSDITVTIDGTTITGGTADMGGGVYTAGAPVKLEGDAVIRENTTGSLYLNAGVELDVTGLTQGADVHLYNMSSMFLGSDATVLKYMTLERSGYKTATIAGKLVLVPESFAIPTEVEGFQVGFGRADITPTEVGIPLAGYGNAAQRLSKDVGANEYDKLMVTTVAITDENGQTVLLMSVDLIRPSAALMSTILPAVSAATGVPEGNIFTTFTHTHSVPETNQTTHPTIKRYNAMLPDRFAESANLAMADRAAATMQAGSFEVDGLNFTRHYQYEEDGIVKYFGDNFGTATVNSTTKHVTEADHTMHLVKFTRDGKDILMANWRVHPHMTGGSSKYVVSADIIGTTRYYVESKAAEIAQTVGDDAYDMHFIYLQGAAGNVNETSKLASEKHGLDYVEYGEELSTQILFAVYPELLSPQTTSCMTAVEEIGTLQVDNYSYTATADKATQTEYEHAKAAKAAYEEWLEANPNASSTAKRNKCEELGYLTTFHFNNVITRYGLNDTYELPLNTFNLGSNLAFFTAPGELWDTVSMEVEEASPFAMTMCIGYSQDHYNYFVYDPTNGGEMTYESYESNNYRFVAPDTINDMIAYWKQTLDELYSNLEN